MLPSVLAGETAARAAAERAGILVVASPSVADLLARACPPGVRPRSRGGSDHRRFGPLVGMGTRCRRLPAHGGGAAWRRSDR